MVLPRTYYRSTILHERKTYSSLQAVRQPVKDDLCAKYADRSLRYLFEDLGGIHFLKQYRRGWIETLWQLRAREDCNRLA